MATVLEERTRETTMRRRLPIDFGAWAYRAMPWVVFAAAVGIGMVLYADFWSQSRHLWYTIDHDRSAHYEFGVNLAMDVRTGNLPGLLHHLNGARVWGPLHGIVLGAVQLVAGPEYRLGILPSWLAWIATAVLAFLIPRRLLREGGTAAGILAAMLVLLSPAHRAFATDVMLESMGAALTLLCVLRYLIAVQDGGEVAGKWLGLSLTLLFLTKSNYWLLVAVGFMAGECLRQPSAAWGYARAAAGVALRRDWIVGQLRNPWNYAIAIPAVLAAAVVVYGGTTLEIGRFHIRMTTGHNLLHIAYILAFIRAAIWWRRERIGDALATIDPIWRTLAAWHAWPVAAYFLLPKRLGYFLWFVSPANSSRAIRGGGAIDGAKYYFQGLATDYHAIVAMAIAAVACAVIGLAFVRRWKPGAATAYLFLALIALATCQHPMLKYRHAHSWVALIWVLGSAALVYAITRITANRGVRTFLAAAVCGGVAVLHGPFWLAPGHAQEGGLRADAPCLLDLTESYLPTLHGSHHATILSNVYSPFFYSWTAQEELRHPRIATEIKNIDLARPDPAVLKTWADKTPSDRVVVVEVGETSPFFVKLPETMNAAAVREFFEQNPDRFTRTLERHLTQNVRVTIWQVNR